MGALMSIALTITVLVPQTSAAAEKRQIDPGSAPATMASLGDSITRGFNSCGWYVDCPARSWATGDHDGLNSHYQRIHTKNPEIAGKNINVAATGATSFSLPEQARLATKSDAQYVTILIGANDACRASEDQMTSAAVYRANVDAALSVINANAPQAKVFVSSVPDVKRLWAVAKDSFKARMAWAALAICKSLLANPASTAPADEQRRDRVRQRVVDFNTQLEQACTDYGDRCVFDNNAVFNTQFTLDQVSGWDYFHPNVGGQKRLADVTYRAGFGW